VSLRHDYSLGPLLLGETTWCGSALLSSLYCIEQDDYINSRYVN
jgi:hypothetical protein